MKFMKRIKTLSLINPRMHLDEKVARAHDLIDLIKRKLNNYGE